MERLQRRTEEISEEVLQVFWRVVERIESEWKQSNGGPPNFVLLSRNISFYLSGKEIFVLGQNGLIASLHEALRERGYTMKNGQKEGNGIRVQVCLTPEKTAQKVHDMLEGVATETADWK